MFAEGQQGYQTFQLDQIQTCGLIFGSLFSHFLVIESESERARESSFFGRFYEEFLVANDGAVVSLDLGPDEMDAWLSLFLPNVVS